MYKSTWKDLRKLKKAQVRKRAAYTKPCRYGSSCSNDGCMFYHEGSRPSSSHVSSNAELTAQGQGASYEVEQGNSDNGEPVTVTKQDDASEMVKRLQAQLKEKDELIDFLTDSNISSKKSFDILKQSNENKEKIIRKMEVEAENKTKTKTKTKKKCERETRDTDSDDRRSKYKIVKNRYGREVRSL